MVSAAKTSMAASVIGRVMAISLWTHPAGFDAEARAFILVGERHPVSEQRTGVAGIDDLFDAEGLGRTERTAHGIEPRLDLGHQRGAIGRSVELAAVGGFDAPLERQRAPFTRRPRVTEIEGLDVRVAGAGHAEHAAHDDGDPGNAGLVDRLERTHAAPDGPVLLGLSPDEH